MTGALDQTAAFAGAENRRKKRSLEGILTFSAHPKVRVLPPGNGLVKGLSFSCPQKLNDWKVSQGGHLAKFSTHQLLNGRGAIWIRTFWNR